MKTLPLSRFVSLLLPSWSELPTGMVIAATAAFERLERDREVNKILGLPLEADETDRLAAIAGITRGQSLNGGGRQIGKQPLRRWLEADVQRPVVKIQGVRVFRSLIDDLVAADSDEQKPSRLLTVSRLLWH